MAKIKSRDKRKKQQQRKSNQATEQKRKQGKFVKSFDGYMQLTLKRETDDKTIRKNVIRCDDWLKRSFQIFKHDRQYYVELTMFKYDESFEPAVMGVETTHKIHREDIATVAGAIADELSAGHEDINFDKSYIRIYA